LPAKEILRQKPNIYKAWKKFITRGKIDSKIIQPVIIESWKRCVRYGIDPFGKHNTRLSERELNHKFEKFNHLIKVARPFMQSLYKFVKDSGFIVRLSDNEGCILETLGDKSIVDSSKELNILPGDNCSEQIIGTNAIGTCLVIQKPLQVFAAEHYCKAYHSWTTSACPIRDTKGRIIGALGMTGSYEKVHPHTLGMIIAAVEAIENQLKLEESNRKLLMSNQHFYAIMESISEGLISIDNNGNITDINLEARKLFGIKEKDVLGKHIKKLFNSNYKKIQRVLNHGIGFSEEEIVLYTKRRGTVRFISTATPIKDEKNNTAGAVITFREIKTVHNLINKMIGSEARFTFESILGKSQKLLEAIKIAKLAAKNDTNVLLQGESGTGKEMFAQAIHNNSSRRDGPFIFINCGAIPRELVASELFGYVEGAFTGARKGGHPGKFELADGGTIFLDEIGDMPLDTQANLLRVLETKEIRRIGGKKVIPINVRVIAATHKNLEKEVEHGNFRQDLFFRLNVTPIKIPPLRERKEDIPLLVKHFTKKIGHQMNKHIEDIHPEVIDIMCKYDWPGNVRELQNVLQQAINMCDKNVLTVENLPDSIKTSETSSRTSNYTKTLKSLEELEAEAIYNTLKAVNGNIAQTARILGIGRNTLYRKMKKYRINP